MRLSIPILILALGAVRIPAAAAGRRSGIRHGMAALSVDAGAGCGPAAAAAIRTAPSARIRIGIDSLIGSP